jgi:hypothetical protein
MYAGTGHRDGGEVILYSRHLSEVSHTTASSSTGRLPPDYFMKQWDKFRTIRVAGTIHHVREWGADEQTSIESPHSGHAGDYPGPEGAHQPGVSGSETIAPKTGGCERRGILRCCR